MTFHGRIANYFGDNDVEDWEHEDVEDWEQEDAAYCREQIRAGGSFAFYDSSAAEDARDKLYSKFAEIMKMIQSETSRSEAKIKAAYKYKVEKRKVALAARREANEHARQMKELQVREFELRNQAASREHEKQMKAHEAEMLK
ncbi:hypothetical protein SERLADRAFT_391456, partial [Serpula lacrymans var. lacrymans S7.9]